jgi:hypothetical protein
MIKIFLLVFLVGCSTLPSCYKIDDIIERTRCYENEKQKRFYDEVGWRYYEHRMERIGQ